MVPVLAIPAPARLAPPSPPVVLDLPASVLAPLKGLASVSMVVHLAQVYQAAISA